MAMKQKQDEEVYGIRASHVHPQFNIPIHNHIFVDYKHPLVTTKDERDTKCLRWFDGVFDEKTGWRSKWKKNNLILNPEFILTESEKKDIEKLYRKRMRHVHAKLQKVVEEVQGMMEDAELHEPRETLADEYRSLAYTRKLLLSLENISVPRL